MNAERLLKLAELLDGLPPERFDYKTWVGHSWNGKPLNECDTKACALGWATTIPEFGLKLVLATRLRIACVTTLDDSCDSGGPVPEYGKSQRAGMYVFGIDHDEFDYLFTPRECDGWDNCDGDHELDDGGSTVCSLRDDNAGPKDVAEKIRAFVAAGGVP